MLLHLGIPWQKNRKGGGLPPPWSRRVGWVWRGLLVLPGEQKGASLGPVTRCRNPPSRCDPGTARPSLTTSCPMLL